MDSHIFDGLMGRPEQTRVIRRLLLRRILRRKREQGREQDEIDEAILMGLLDEPSLENVDRLCLAYGHGRVRRAISLADNLIFEEFFYGKLFFYPLWLKHFTRLLDVAARRSAIRELAPRRE